MISFYPGPSRVYASVPRLVQAAYDSGLLVMNHRSEEFMRLYRNTERELKSKLRIPKSYAIWFASSATECWEMVAQSLVKEKSTHVYNGAFGEKWFHYTSRLRPGATAVPFSTEEKLPTNVGETEVICITQNETSNGTQVSNALLSKIRKQHPTALLAVDATSSMAGIRLPFASADVWFASVQKCFGLPAGLAVMAVSPPAQERIRLLGESSHYNSLSLVDSMAARFQTSCTPNVLGIYLLGAIMKQVPSIEIVHQQTVSRYEAWMDFFAASDRLTPLVKNASVRSHTVITINGEPEYLIRVKQQAARAGFLLGEGYGSLKSSTFRIANFPALQSGEINKLRKFLKPWL